jgi:putative spermidine/putrescine transport system permease protein
MPGRIGRSIMIGCFALFVLFLYGPTLTIMILSFQGPDGGLTFPMNGVSLHWFANLFERQAVGDFGGSMQRSLLLGLMVMATTVVVSVLAGLAFRRRFRGAGLLFTLTVASLIVPSILVGLGIGLLFNLAGWDPAWYGSAFGASPWQTFRSVVLPIIAPGVVGIALFGFTLSYDEFARTLLTAGSDNTLPLEIFGMTTNITTPVLYALGTLTTLLSALVIGAGLFGVMLLRRRRANRR